MLSKVVNRPVAPEDVPLISALHDRVFGPGRFARTAYRVRERMGGGSEVSRFCRLAMAGDTLIAALRMSEIAIGGRSGAVLLGPLVVAPDHAGQGYGRALIGEAVEAARTAGMAIVVLVGDEPYYARFGFRRVAPGAITFPGPVDPARILAAELKAGALADYHGQISARTVVPSPRVGEGQGGGKPGTLAVGRPPTPNPSPRGVEDSPPARRGRE